MKSRTGLLNLGSWLMFLAALAFIGYAVVFFLRNFFSSGFELGVQTIGGSTRAALQSSNPELLYYVGHLHVATAGFIAATGIAVAFLSWYGVRRGELWAWIGAVAAPVAGLAVALPMHWFGLFQHNWVTHLGPIYLATLVFVIGALIVLKGIMLPVEQSPSR